MFLCQQKRTQPIRRPKHDLSFNREILEASRFVDAAIFQRFYKLPQYLIFYLYLRFNSKDDCLFISAFDRGNFIYDYSLYRFKQANSQQTCLKNLIAVKLITLFFSQVFFISYQLKLLIAFVLLTMDTPEQKAQSAKFGYKAPESVYQKHDPKASLVGSGTSSEHLEIFTTSFRLVSLIINSQRTPCLKIHRKSIHWCLSDGLLPSPKRSEESRKGQNSRDQSWYLSAQYVQGQFINISP